MERRFDVRRRTHASRKRLRAVFVLVFAAAIATAGTCAGTGGNPVLGARDGIREAESPALVALPLGRINAMGGNWSLRRIDFSIDTRLGPREIGATWNAASATWRWSTESSYWRTKSTPT